MKLANIDLVLEYYFFILLSVAVPGSQSEII